MHLAPETCMERDKKGVCSLTRSRLRLWRNYFAPTYNIQHTRTRPLFTKGLFPATIAPLFNHRARPLQIKTARRDLLRGPRQNGRGVVRVCERRRKNGKLYEAPRKGHS